jgi:DNA-binding NarL/FixJ family response regulator
VIDLLIADHAPTRMGLRLALADVAVICAEAGDAIQAITEAERTQPDVCIVGLEIPGGMTAVGGICSVAPDARVVVLSIDPNPDELLTAVRLGAIGYLPANTSAQALCRVVQGTASGEAAIPRTMVSELAREVRGAAGDDQQLTPRELQVRAMLRDGCSTAVIAEQLRISPVTVRRHVSLLMHKVGATSRAAV